MVLWPGLDTQSPVSYGTQSFFLCIGPDIEPNLWMWVNPNIVFPPGKLEVPESSKGEDLTSRLPCPQPAPREEDFANCSEAKVMESLPPSSREQSFPWKQFASSPSNWEVGISGVVGREGIVMMHQRVLGVFLFFVFCFF